MDIITMIKLTSVYFYCLFQYVFFFLTINEYANTCPFGKVLTSFGGDIVKIEELSLGEGWSKADLETVKLFIICKVAQLTLPTENVFTIGVVSDRIRDMQVYDKELVGKKQHPLLHGYWMRVGKSEKGSSL